MFEKQWFLDKFKEFPLLLKFATKKVQTSTDVITSVKNPLSWQKTLYSTLQELKPEININDVKFDELERTILSLMFLEAILPKNIDNGLDFIKEHKSDLTREDIHKIWGLINEGKEISDEDYHFINLACIFGDIGKIDQIRHDFEEKGLVSQDQDLAHDYILGHDTQELMTYFDLSKEAIIYLKNHVFPLHLGHAAQGECTAKKFAEAQFFLKKFSKEEAKKIVKSAVFKQIIDVAGARGQSGTILLNKAILNAYLQLCEALIDELIDKENNPSQVYWKYVTKPILSKNISFPDSALNAFQTAIDVESYSKEGLVWRLILQLRILQSSEKINENAVLVADIITELLKNETFKELVKCLKDYDEQALHTFTYGPAILSTLKSQAEKTPALISGIANSPIEFAIKVGIKIEASACKAYLDHKEYSPLLLENPLNFNDLNGEIQKDVQVALNIYNEITKLNIEADGKVTTKTLVSLTDSKNEDIKTEIDEKLKEKCRWKVHQLLMQHGYYKKPLLQEYPILKEHELLQSRAACPKS